MHRLVVAPIDPVSFLEICAPLNTLRIENMRGSTKKRDTIGYLRSEVKDDSASNCTRYQDNNE